MAQIIIIDYGEPSIGKIKQILSTININSVIIKPTDDIPFTPIGVILSGGPDHVYHNNARKLPLWIFVLQIPVLGICYGMELIVHHFGGQIKSLPQVLSGNINLHHISNDVLLTDITCSDYVCINCSDYIHTLPANLKVTSFFDKELIGSITDNKKWWGVIWHPEVSVDIRIFRNFINLCL